MRSMELKEQPLGSIKEGDIFHTPSRLRRKGVYLLSPFAENVDADGNPQPPATSAFPRGQMMMGHMIPSSPTSRGRATGDVSPPSSLSASSVDISSLCGQDETSPTPSVPPPNQSTQ